MKKLIVSLAFLLPLVVAAQPGTDVSEEQSRQASDMPVRVVPAELAIEKGYPVHLFADTLFYIKTRLASLTPQERAANITERLHKVYKDDFLTPEDITLKANGNYMDIICDETVIMSVSERDAAFAELTNVELAGQYANKMKEAFVKARADRSLLKTLMRVGLVLLVLGGIFFLIRLIIKGHLWLESRIAANKEKLLKNLSYKDYTFLTADQELVVISWLLKAFKWSVIV